MPVIEINITKLDGKRNKPQKVTGEPSLKISNNSKVIDIRKEKLPKLGDTIVVDFEYETNYEPAIGKIVVGGTIVYHEKNMKDFIEEKKGDVILKGEAYATVQNAILGVGTINALLLAKELKLPAPIQLPTVELKNKKDEDSGKSYA